MTVRRRLQKRKDGSFRESWVADFRDATRKRHWKSFKTKREAAQYEKLAAAARNDFVPMETMRDMMRPFRFSVVLPDGALRTKDSRAKLKQALRAARPLPRPTSFDVVLHIVIELPPRAVIADVDNLL